MHPLYQKIFPAIAKVCYLPPLSVVGFEAQKLLGVTTNLVYRGTYEGKPAVAKFMTQRFPHVQQMLEAEHQLLTAFRHNSLTPNPYSFFSQLPTSNITGIQNLIRHGAYQRDELTVLVREYIPGRRLNSSDRISQKTLLELEALMKGIHHLGFSGIGLANLDNFVIDKDKNFKLIDLGAEAQKGKNSEERFMHFMRRDFEEMRLLKTLVAKAS